MRWQRHFAKNYNEILLGNNVKYSDFIDGKYFGGKLALKRTPLFKENRF